MHHTPQNFKELSGLKGITYASLNVCSISRKFPDIKVMLSESKLDLLLIYESWLNHSIGDPELHIPGYTLHRYDRDLGNGKCGGGGLLAYSRDHYQFDDILNWNICCPDVEIQWLKLSLPHTRPTYIANIYRPPDGNLDVALNTMNNKLIDIHGERPGDIVIMGDLNVDLLAKRDQKTTKYVSFIKSCNLCQLIKLPTRVGIHKASLLDHCLTNREDYYHLVGTL